MAAARGRQKPQRRRREALIPGHCAVAELSLVVLPEGTMIRLDRRQRDALSETVRELANFVAAALVVGQFVASQPASWRLIFVGVFSWVVFVGCALMLEGER